MGRTNIRKAKDLIDRAGTDTDEMAVIPQLDNLQLPLHITCRSFGNEELKCHVHGLKNAQNDIWMLKQLGHLANINCYVPSNEPESYRVPHVTISHGLQNFWADDADEPALQQHEVAYILVVHGRPGHMHKKLVVRWDREGVAQAMLSEVQNGFSVVFSGVVLKKQWLASRSATKPAKNGGRIKPANDGGRIKLAKVADLGALRQGAIAEERRLEERREQERLKHDGISNYYVELPRSVDKELFRIVHVLC